MEKMSSKKKMIIDTDCGVDDAHALLLALNQDEHWDILAITCCFGNTYVESVCQNVMRVLLVCDKTQIPIYSGCHCPLITDSTADFSVHSEDGFGGVASHFSTGGLEVCNEHASNALVRLAKMHKNQVELMALGPLTNIALAQRLDPDFTKNLKEIFVMGGNVNGIGNATATAEFNFATDPESAYIVMTESQCAITLVPWETCCTHGLEWDFAEKWIETDTHKGRFVKKITEHLIAFCKKMNDPKLELCDFLAMAAAVCPESVSKAVEYPVLVELCGKHTRGQTVIDKRPCKMNDFCNNQKNVKIITEFNDEILKKLHNNIMY